MNDSRAPVYGSRGSVCVNTSRILDSCRDKDCYEDVKVFLGDFGQDIIEKANSIRVRDTTVLCCNITSDPIQFNRGFYQITVKIYTKIIFECCICPGKTQEIEGIAVTEKKVVLFGGEGNIRSFSSQGSDFCSPCIDADEGSCKPHIVVDLVDPIALSCRIADRCEPCCCPCCSCGDIPSKVFGCISGNLCDYPPQGKVLLVSLGFFSVIRIERPAQLILQANEYSIPDKECPGCSSDSPCEVFSRMDFPVSEFTTSIPVVPPQSCQCRK